ncbi:hypothetical protein KJ975_02965 [Myxococcota bacterium]|nr:hypothetical protein [Myxococcota bacterium]
MKKTLPLLFSLLVLTHAPAASASAQPGRLFRAVVRQVFFTASTYCTSLLDRTTYGSGFAASDFSSSMSMTVDSGKLKLVTDAKALGDVNRIINRTRQTLKVLYVKGLAESNSLGWFLWDDRVKNFTLPDGVTCSVRACATSTDCDTGETCAFCSGVKRCTYPRYKLRDDGYGVAGAGNGIYDWLENIYTKPGGSTDVYTVPQLLAPMPYSWNDLNITRDAWMCTTRSCSNDGNCLVNERCQYGCASSKRCTYPRFSNYNGWTYVDKLWDYDYHLLSNTSTTLFSDGGTYPRISNLLETLMDTGGGMIFKVTDDDDDPSTEKTGPAHTWYYDRFGSLYGKYIYWQWPNFTLTPEADISATDNNGVPDYDTNGDGSVNDLDRTVDIGTFDAGTELVFFLNTYWRNYNVRYESVAMKQRTTGDNNTLMYLENARTFSMPFFNKGLLNPDYWGTTDTATRTINIGCPFDVRYGGGTRWDILVCQVGTGFQTWLYNTSAYSSGSSYSGWLDVPTLTRLNSAAYNFLAIPHETVTFDIIRNGYRQHMALGAPSNDPTRWILGFTLLYDGGVSPGSSLWPDWIHNSFNHLVFLVNRQNGGEAISNVMSSEIPASQLANTTITKVKIKKDDYIPIPPCTPYPDTRIDYYISVSEPPVWVKVEFPPGSDETTIDLASLGYTGAYLRWKVEIISSDESCQPEVRDLDIGYEALKGGEYSFSTSLPLANVLFKGVLETPTSGWTVTGNDLRNRGHFSLYEMYAPETPTVTSVTEKWDAGTMLAARDPSSRVIYTHAGTTRLSFTNGTNTWLLNEVLSPTDRALRHNGRAVYDLNENFAADDNDARQIIQWTRGLEYPLRSVWPATVPRRAWPLGAIHRSTAAIVTPPGYPNWLNQPGIPAAVKSSYTAWMNDPLRAERATIAVVGAQDGMLHAFAAGSFRRGDDPTTGGTEQRGYFVKSGTTRTYGNGAESWAWIPPSQLNNLKNNYVRDYYPEQNPWAQVNGSITLDDILVGSAWKTAVFYTHGVVHPFLSALDVTTTTDPQILWDHDWTDADFNGTYQPPALAWMNSSGYSGQGRTWATITSSGMSDAYGDVYLYVIDADNGNTLPNGKIKLNTGSGAQANQALGVWGSPVVVDFDEDGYADRVYVADTNGRIWKHYFNGTNLNRCMLANVGPEPIFVTPAIKLATDMGTGQKVVTLYFGTGDHPEQNDTPAPPYHFYGFVDRDADGACSTAEMIYSLGLSIDEKVWADAFISGDEVYVGTSKGDKADICDEDTGNPGRIYILSVDADTSGLPIQITPSVAAPGNVVSGLQVYDEHLFVNSLGGTTSIVGDSKWNNTSASSASSTGVEDVYWKEE